MDRWDGGRQRRTLRRTLAANLVLNAGWNWLFLTAHRPDLATVEALL